MSTENLGLETIELTDNMQTSLLQKMNSNFNKIDENYGILKNDLLEKTGKSTIAEAIEYINELAELANLANLGDATEKDIINGKTAVVQGKEVIGTGFAINTTATSYDLIYGKTAYTNKGQLLYGLSFKETTTATSNDIMSGKTAYSNTGTLITGEATATVNIPTINITKSGSYRAYLDEFGAGINQDGTLVIWATSDSENYEHILFVDTSIGAGTIGVGWNLAQVGTSGNIGVPYACTVNGLSQYNTIDITLNVTAVNTTNDYFTVEVTLTAS